MTRSTHAAIAVAAAGSLALAALLQVHGETHVTVFGWTFPELCFWRRSFGWECPTCGLTRSCVALAHGDWTSAWRYHRAGFLVVGLVAWQIPYRTWRLGQASRRERDVASDAAPPQAAHCVRGLDVLAARVPSAATTAANGESVVTAEVVSAESVRR